MAPRKNSQSTAAELSLVHLQKCLVNLPSSLVSLLSNVDTVYPRLLSKYLVVAVLVNVSPSQFKMS